MATITNVTPFPFESHIAKLEPQVQYVIKNLWNSIGDVQNAVPILKSQIDTNKTSIAATNKVVNNNISTQTVTQTSTPNTGFLNNQSGNTSYTTLPSDYGAYILFSNSSPIALTLSTASGAIQLPWYCTVLNEGVGLVTATPATGTISYPNNTSAASMSIAQGQAAVLIYNGTNYYGYIVPVIPQSIAATTSKWLDSFTASTGTFTSSQPAIADILGLSAALALLAPIASPTFTGTVTEPTPPVLTAAVTDTSATAGSATALPVTPLGYLEMSVNGVTVKIPYYSV